jgi:hypothetical protein
MTTNSAKEQRDVTRALQLAPEEHRDEELSQHKPRRVHELMIVERFFRGRAFPPSLSPLLV